jgi:exopolysaccharide production protein ExoQ
MGATVAAAPGSGSVRAPGGPIPWLLTILSVSLLGLETVLGGLGIGLFLMLWLGYAAAWPVHALDTLRRQTVLWLYPGIALLSLLWTVAPSETLRHGLQLCLGTAVAIVVIRSVSKEDFVLAVLCVLLPQMLLGIVLGGWQYTETGARAATGFFASKNLFAQFVSVMLFASIGVLGNPGRPMPVRAFALAGVAAAPVLLLAAHSTGALVTAFPCVLTMLILLSLTALPRRYRPLAIFCYVAVLGLVVILVAAAVLTEGDAILGLLGKGSGLNGRDVLWARAQFLISQRPALGVGYQAFWVQGNLDAEGLWRVEHITSRSGFHFHNFFYETAVELGYIGFAIVTAQFLIVASTVIAWGLRAPGGESAFFSALVVFYLLRSPVEVDFGPFGLTPLLVPAGYIYARITQGR